MIACSESQQRHGNLVNPNEVTFPKLLLYLERRERYFQTTYWLLEETNYWGQHSLI